MNVRLETGREYAWQWDLDLRLILEGVDPGTEVYFAPAGASEAPVLEAYADAGQIYADVPNNILQKAGDVSVYVYDGQTKYSSYFRVLGRTKPADYVYTETEVKRYETLERRIDALEKSGLPGFSNAYEGLLLYVAGGILTPLKLGPGLSIRDGTLYVSGGSGAPDEPVGVVVAVSVVDGVEVLTDTTGQIVARIVDGVESVTGPTDAVTASIDDDVETISSKEVT